MQQKHHDNETLFRILLRIQPKTGPLPSRRIAFTAYLENYLRFFGIINHHDKLLELNIDTKLTLCHSFPLSVLAPFGLLDPLRVGTAYVIRG